MNLNRAIFALIAIIFASCSTSNDVVSNRFIQKRKYRKGYFIANHQKSKADKAETVKALVQCIEGVVEIASERKEPQLQGTASWDPPQSNSSTVNQKPSTVDRQPSTTEELAVQEESAVEPRAGKPLFDAKNWDNAIAPQIQKASVSNDNAELAIYLIIAFFLPPIPIYILYGLEVEFWLSLVLFILGWLPGVIYAFVKILQVYS